MLSFFTGSSSRQADADRTFEMEAKLAGMDRSLAVIEFQLDGTVIAANSNFLATMGYQSTDVVGRNHSMFVDPAEATSPEYRHFWQRLNAGEHVTAKFRRIGRGGKEIWIQASYTPLVGKDGKPFKIVKFASDITAAEEERRRSDEERAARSTIQARVVDALARGLEELSEGKLTYRLSEAMPAEYERLRSVFNSAMERLHKAMQAFHANAQAIRSGNGEIATAADDLARRTEQQAASLEQTAASLDEITATVKQTAEGAKHARDAVGVAKEDAEKGGTVVRNAIEAMSGIEKSSKQIGQIIGVIDEIAFQTNLLALNAGVEAARAGEAGRGFAVVASEVRALAQRSAEAAKEIKELISASSDQVDRGVGLVQESGQSLERIVTQIAEINSVVSGIAASAQEQATGLHQINAAVNQMDQVTQQNAAMVEETTAAAHSLDRETEELGRLLGNFEIGAAPLASASRRAAPAPARAPVKAAATRGGTAAARKIEAAPSAQNWEEF